MKKSLAVLAVVCGLSFSSLAQADQVSDSYMQGAYQYLGDARSSFSQGMFVGITLSRAYDTPDLCGVEGSSNKEVLTKVASVLMRSVDIDKSGNAYVIADIGLKSAFPCKGK